VPDQQTNGFVGDQNAWFGQNTAQMGGMPNMFSAHGVAGTPWGDYSMMQNMQGGWVNGYGGMMGTQCIFPYSILTIVLMLSVKDTLWA